MKKGDSSSKVFFKGFLGVLCEGGVHLGEVQINGLENYEMYFTNREEDCSLDDHR